MNLTAKQNMAKCCIVLLVLLSAFLCPGKIGVQYQMQLGNPSDAKAEANNHKHFLVQRSVFALDYDDDEGEPNWVSWDLTADDIASAKRTSRFKSDAELPTEFHHIKSADYKDSGFDRGHMCPSADRTDNSTDNESVFVMSNIIPQSKDNNEGVWEKLESDCRTMAENGNELLIISGPSAFNGNRLPNGPVMIPSHTWKIVVEVPNGPGSALSRITIATRVFAVDIPNVDGIRRDPWKKYLVSVNQLEAETGLKFFTALPKEVATILKRKVDGQPESNWIIAGKQITNSTNANVLLKGSSTQINWVLKGCVILSIALVFIIILMAFLLKRLKN